jgi:hypothetical protein
LFGVPKIELDLEAQAIEFDDLVAGLFQVGAEQNDMRLRGGCEMGLDHTHLVEWAVKRFVEELTLINSCAQVVFHAAFFQLAAAHVANLDFVAVPGFGAALLGFAHQGQIQRRIRTQFGDQVYTGLSDQISAGRLFSGLQFWLGGRLFLPGCARLASFARIGLFILHIHQREGKERQA